MFPLRVQATQKLGKPRPYLHVVSVRHVAGGLKSAMRIMRRSIRFASEMNINWLTLDVLKSICIIGVGAKYNCDRYLDQHSTRRLPLGGKREKSKTRNPRNATAALQTNVR